MTNIARPYNVVLFGATGYTGSLTAEYFAKAFPKHLNWAIAGRSASKLELVARKCRDISHGTQYPAIQVCGLDDTELGHLARSTAILVSTVGPYSIYGEHAVKACAENGTHYFDVTGECAFVHKMIKKYDHVAKRTGAILIPQAGVESTPADLIAWSLVNFIREKYSLPTGQVILSIHDFISTPSGGTSATALALNETFTTSELVEANTPFALSPLPGPKSPESFFARTFGVSTVPELGTITSSIAGIGDKQIVDRSWGIFGGSKLYGPHFHFRAVRRTPNIFTGFATHCIVVISFTLLYYFPLKWILKKPLYQPGGGPKIEDTKSHRLEYRAVAFADGNKEDQRKVVARVAWEGGMYEFTAMLLGQACLTLLEDEVMAKNMGGGILTPATLGKPFVARMREEGFGIDIKMG